MKNVTYTFISIILTTLFISCSTPAITQEEFSTLQDTVEDLSSRVDTLETLSQDKTVDLDSENAVVNSDIEKSFELSAIQSFLPILDLFPEGTTLPLPNDSITRGVIDQNNYGIDIFLIYEGQEISETTAKCFKDENGGEINTNSDILGGSPGWEIQIGDLTYSLFNLDPQNWYNGYIEVEEKAAGIMLKYKESSTPELTTWFNSEIFDYSTYPMHQILLDLLPPNYTAFSTDGQKVIAGSTWDGFCQDEIREIYDYYFNLYSDNEYIQTTGDVSEFAHLFTILDENHAFEIKTSPSDDGYKITLIMHFE